MPFVRIDLKQGKSAEFRREVGNIVYQAIIDTVNVPTNDRFQVITEHEQADVIYDPNHLNIQRTDGLIFVQITLNGGRTVEQKRRCTRLSRNGSMKNWMYARKMCLLAW
jgi:4-oxalocrotonate tautomerase